MVVQLVAVVTLALADEVHDVVVVIAVLAAVVAGVVTLSYRQLAKEEAIPRGPESPRHLKSR